MRTKNRNRPRTKPITARLPGRNATYVRSEIIVAAIIFNLITIQSVWAFEFSVKTVAELHQAVRNAQTGDHIVIEPGSYQLTSVLNFTRPGITIRGRTGNRDDVVLVGGGMNTRGVDEGLSLSANNITVMALTLRDFYYNAIHIRAENDVDGTVISNVKTIDIGERHIKGSRDPSSATLVSDNTLIENVHMLQTKGRTGHPDTHPDYIGGIDIMASRNIIIRDSRFENIRGQNNGGNAAIFLWQGIENATIERNVIVGCAKGIALGNPYGPDLVISTAPYHAEGALIRNNFVKRGIWISGNNIGLELASVRSVTVAHNTFYSDDPTYFRTISFSEASPGLNTNIVLRQNIIRGAIMDFTDGSGWQSISNLLDTVGAIDPGWFVNAATADFHLTGLAIAAIDTGEVLPEVGTDFDNQARPIGNAPDIGADEFGVSAPPPPEPDPTPPPRPIKKRRLKQASTCLRYSLAGLPCRSLR